MLSTQSKPEFKLLLVEDDDVDAHAFCRSLRKADVLLSVRRAYDGAEALEIMNSGEMGQPYVIILDIQMPKINGLEFMGIIRKDPKFTNSLVFMLTTSNDEQDISQAYAYHVAGYFLKHRNGRADEQIVNVLSKYWQTVELPKQGTLQ